MNVFVLLNTKEDILKNVEESSSGARGVASGGKRVTECIGLRGLEGPRSPGHREYLEIPFK